MSNAGPRRTWTTLAWVSLCAVCMACLLAGCGKSDESAERKTQPKFEVADDGTTSAQQKPAATATGRESEMPPGEAVIGSPGSLETVSGEPTQPPAISVNQLEAITVPDGTAEELLDFTNETGDKIMALRAKMGGPGRPAAKPREIELFQALITASEKVLALDNATSHQRRAAVENKAGAMSWLSRLEPEKDWSSKVQRFAASLAADKDPKVALEGKSILFGMHLGEFAHGRNPDANALLNQLRPLLRDKARSNVVMGVALQTMNTLLGLGFDDQAREVLDLIVAAYKDHADPELAREAARLAERALIMDAEIEPKFNAVVAKRDGASEAFVTELTKILAGTPGSLTLETGARYIGIFQQTGQYEIARKLCQMFQDAYANNKNQETKKQAAQVTQTALHRLDLLGKPLAVDARRLDGAALDFSFYQGKVVLVIFFAAFDARCQQEMMNVKNVYKEYHEQGFEVIAVSVDPNRELLKQFLDQAKFSWVTVTNNKFAEQCGADMLPFGILLDRTGKVTDIFVQGPVLKTKLEILLGDPATKPPATGPPATGPPATGALSPLGKQSRLAPSPTTRQGATRFVANGLVAAVCAAVVATEAFGAAGEATQQAPQEEVADKVELSEAEEAVNPYLAKVDLTPAELINFLFDMQDKPKSIRRRAGFTEAVVDAADRVLRSSTKAKYQLIAAETKLAVLHQAACLGDEEADQQLSAFVGELAADQRPAIVHQVKFYQLERRCLDADSLELKVIPSLLTDLQTFYESQEQLAHQHLRIASATVHVINRIEDAKQREEYFSKFGNLFAKSGDRQLARYGKKLAKGGKGRASDLVGKPLELEGITDLGTPLDWSSYRGSVVVVDFWATWCGPCLREMPHLRTLYDELSDSGLDVVAVSLDEDLEALAKFLEEKKLPWPNLVGENARQLATKHDVRGIPTMMLIDQQGKIVAVTHHVDSLRPQIKKLLSASSK